MTTLTKDIGKCTVCNKHKHPAEFENPLAKRFGICDQCFMYRQRDWENVDPDADRENLKEKAVMSVSSPEEGETCNCQHGDHANANGQLHGSMFNQDIGRQNWQGQGLPQPKQDKDSCQCDEQPVEHDKVPNADARLGEPKKDKKKHKGLVGHKGGRIEKPKKEIFISDLEEGGDGKSEDRRLRAGQIRARGKESKKSIDELIEIIKKKKKKRGGRTGGWSWFDKLQRDAKSKLKPKDIGSMTDSEKLDLAHYTGGEIISNTPKPKPKRFGNLDAETLEGLNIDPATGKSKKDVDGRKKKKKKKIVKPKPTVKPSGGFVRDLDDPEDIGNKTAAFIKALNILKRSPPRDAGYTARRKLADEMKRAEENMNKIEEQKKKKKKVKPKPKKSKFDFFNRADKLPAGDPNLPVVATPSCPYCHGRDVLTQGGHKADIEGYKKLLMAGEKMNKLSGKKKYPNMNPDTLSRELRNFIQHEKDPKLFHKTPTPPKKKKVRIIKGKKRGGMLNYNYLFDKPDIEEGVTHGKKKKKKKQTEAERAKEERAFYITGGAREKDIENQSKKSWVGYFLKAEEDVKICPHCQENTRIDYDLGSFGGKYPFCKNCGYQFDTKRRGTDKAEGKKCPTCGGVHKEDEKKDLMGRFIAAWERDKKRKDPFKELDIGKIIGAKRKAEEQVYNVMVDGLHIIPLPKKHKKKKIKRRKLHYENVPSGDRSFDNKAEENQFGAWGQRGLGDGNGTGAIQGSGDTHLISPVKQKELDRLMAGARYLPRSVSRKKKP